MFDPNLPKTSITLLKQAGADTPQGRASLDKLCRVYRPPVVAMLMYWGAGPVDAEDVAQEFFAKFIVWPLLRDPSLLRGSFGALVRAAVHNELRMHWRAQAAAKRGGATTTTSLDANPGLLDEDERLADAAFFDEVCIRTHVELATEFLETRYRDKDKLDTWNALSPMLRGAQTLAAASGLMGLPEHRVKRKFATLTARFERALRELARDEDDSPEEVIDAEVRRWLEVMRAARAAKQPT